MFAKFLLVATGLIFSNFGLPVSSTFAADRVILSYGAITIADAATEKIVDFAKTGEVSPPIQNYLNILNLNSQQAKFLLTTEIPLSPLIIDQTLSSEVGQLFLTLVSETVTSRNLAADIPALKSALLLSSVNGGTISILKLIQNYPLAELNIDSSKLPQTFPAIESFVQFLSSTMLQNPSNPSNSPQ